MIYALLNKNTRLEDRERIAQAIQDRRVDDLSRYAYDGIITHIMDISPRDTFYCIYCNDQLAASRSNPPRGQRARHPWHFRHNNNSECRGQLCNVGNSIYLNPPDHGCYVQLGCLATHPHTSCKVRGISQSRYCHHAFTTLCPP